MKSILIIPTYNGGELWRTVSSAISAQKYDCEYVLTIDSSSDDNTREISESNGFQLIKIDKKAFNHGGTRNLAIDSIESINDVDIAIFITQDAIPEEHYISKIVSSFEDPAVAIAYGRQLPHDNANPIARHARMFNYGKDSHSLGLSDKPKYGIKTVFTSNSFSAYRINVFKELAGFPSNTILSEDMYLAAKAVLAGYKVAYVAESAVKHSHNYTPLEEFKRYFDIGVFHHDEKWIREAFGGAGGEGKKFIVSEFRTLLKENPSWIPRACLHNALKLFGYKLGQNYKKIPSKYIKKLSMHKRYWDK
ncbi:N-glycosyltransferase [Serratia fonticola]|uniref:N-glycosyltransferase n=1 Tax=Serratia fonticola TaxID=47917 RepID=A0A3S4WYT1_SERFO|nr:N-glycosyltransferase [Serratia fonticola]